MSLQLASLFQHHAVLQRDQVLPVWGWTTPGARLRVTLAGNEAFGISGAAGDFLLRLPALPAGGPHTLKVELLDSGKQLTVEDLLVGEVWLASGQSNMAMSLASCAPDSTETIATADFPQIRYFNVTKRAALAPQRTVDGAWQPATPANAREFSAVAFSFARRLHRELGVPVGIINSSWGGTFIQAWTSRSTLAANPALGPWLAEYDALASTARRWKDFGPAGRIPDFPKDPGNTGLAQGWHLPGFDDTAWPAIKLPATWQFAGHKHTGVFWFRRTVEIPAAWAGQDLVLNLGSADKQDITYVNGIEVGRTGKDFEEQHWNVQRNYPVPASAVTGTSLTIAARVYSFIHDGGLLGPAALMSVHPAGRPADAVPLAGPWRHQCEHNLGVVTIYRLMGHDEPNSPHILFDNMIQPLVPYALRGAIWYQGESNTDNPRAYTRFMRDLIEDWRRVWSRPELAFHLVQLPGYKTPLAHQDDSTWALLREAQLAALALPHTGVSINIDLGEAIDIHPKNKVPVGERLAQSALARTYGHAIAPGGPLFERLTITGNAARCEFVHAGTHLTTTDGAAPLRFHLAGADTIFHPADARIDGTAVIVTSPAVASPVAVRYAWADNPEGCNLASSSGLPASPFRTDVD